MSLKNIIDKETILEKVDTSDEKATIVKKYKDDLLEINVYHLNENRSFYLKSPKSRQGVKSYQVIKGMIDCLNGEKQCHVGDLVVLKFGDDHLFIQTLEKTDLLVHSFNEEAFEATYQNFESIHKILKQIQSKDNYTNDHNKRVYELAHKMGVALGYEGNRLHDLVFAARYHDVGKIFIPDEILNKPSSLTPDEYEIMKTHVSKGEDLINESFNSDIFQIMVQHHERLDGSGYPRGLKGDEIREEGKILAVLDSFDAMTSERIYKKGMSQEAAIKELYDLTESFYERKYVIILESILKDKESQ